MHRRDTRIVIGWDIGGAHVKAARIERGKVTRVRQLPCPLWRGADRLDPTLQALRLELGSADHHVATMTGELADIFPDRAAGVAGITEALEHSLSPESLEIYAGRLGFIVPSRVVEHVADVASANWHATAALVARHGDALLVDIGSTTTDIVALRGGDVCALGRTDGERMVCGELVYTGLTRSFVMALASRAPFAGGWTTIAAEYFASTADIYRILGVLDEQADQMDSADGRAKTVAASRARLARMIGRDAADARETEWRALAEWFAEQQMRLVHDAAMLVLSRAALSPEAPVIAAGVGAAIIRKLADRLGRRCISFADLFGAGAIAWADSCAPAVAVGMLAAMRPPPHQTLA